MTKGDNVKVGIVGHEAAKFTPRTKAEAFKVIRSLLSKGDVLVSGGCHLGGIDIWAEEVADELEIQKMIFLPARLTWSGGFRERNLKIAKTADIVHNIVVAGYPKTYKGRRFEFCYHCGTRDHVKSGGCWTAKKAKQGVWHIIE